VTLLIAAMPVVAYASRLVLHTAVGGEASLLHTVVDSPAALWVVEPFAMGLPLVAAVSRLWDYGAKQQALPPTGSEGVEHVARRKRTLTTHGAVQGDGALAQRRVDVH